MEENVFDLEFKIPLEDPSILCDLFPSGSLSASAAAKPNEKPRNQPEQRFKQSTFIAF